MVACDYCELSENCTAPPIEDSFLLCAAEHGSHDEYVEHLKKLDPTLLKKYKIDIDKISVTVQV